ncbi:hypothetical protein [Butyrivibrio sp. FCS014]|uniref:hypothetical protein n=1 Tax=Butyrivibrio sp. FCS014 TaxID=1408304 RepID=UPI0004645FEE|nr:hypothetical protein [Butyrivibrio sp. FCS014]
MQDKTVIFENDMTMRDGLAPEPQTGALGHFALKNGEKMQDWQDRFCEMAGVYALCISADGTRLTEFSGNPHEVQIIRKYVSDIRIHNIYKRVSDSDLEDQAVEITEIPNLILAAVAVKSGGVLSAVLGRMRFSLPTPNMTKSSLSIRPSTISNIRSLRTNSIRPLIF